jgi:hypothetical protein
MKTLQNQYKLLKEGKGQKDVFLKEAKRLYPNLITNQADFNETETILKQKGLLNEHLIGSVVGTPAINTFEPKKEASYETAFKNFLQEEAKAEEKKVTKEVEQLETKGFDYKNKKNIDNLNGQEFMVGVYYEASNNPKLSLDEIKDKVAKNLSKDELYYVKEGQFGVNVGYQTDVPGLGETKEVKGKYASSGMEVVKEGRILEKGKVREKVRSIIKEHMLGIVSTPSITPVPSFKDMLGFPVNEEAINDAVYNEGKHDDDKEKRELPDSIRRAEEDQIRKDARKARGDIKEEDLDEAKGKDLDGDGDVDSDDYMAAKDAAIKKAKSEKKPKNENISLEKKLKEIEKASTIIAMEAKIAALEEEISSRTGKIDEVEANEAISEFVNPAKIKSMQKEIRLLEKQINKFKKVYERQAGKEYVSEMDAVSWKLKNGMSVDYDPKKVGQNNF